MCRSSMAVMLSLHSGVVIVKADMRGPKIFTDALIGIILPFRITGVKIINLKSKEIIWTWIVGQLTVSSWTGLMLSSEANFSWILEISILTLAICCSASVNYKRGIKLIRRARAFGSTYQALPMRFKGSNARINIKGGRMKIFNLFKDFMYQSVVWRCG